MVRLVVKTAAGAGSKESESRSRINGKNGEHLTLDPSPHPMHPMRRGRRQVARTFRTMVMVFVLIGFLFFCQIIFRPCAAGLPASE